MIHNQMFSALTQSAKSIGYSAKKRASSIGEFAKKHAKRIKRNVADFAYEHGHNPDPSLHVVDTLNEMFERVQTSDNSDAIYYNAQQVLKSIFRGFNGFKYDQIPELNAIYLSHDQTKGTIRHDYLGDMLQHFCGYGFLNRYNSESPGKTTLDDVVTTGRMIVKILSQDAKFKKFCKDIALQKYDASRGEYYIDHDIRNFKVALLMHGGNVASFMNALIVDGGSIGYYGKYKRTIKCWLSAFFSAETAHIIQEIAEHDQRIKLDALKLPLDQFKDYPKRIAALAYIRPIPDVVPGYYDEVVRNIRNFCKTVRQEIAQCDICMDEFKKSKFKIARNSHEVGLQCPTPICHSAHPLCQGCAVQVNTCPSCRKPLEHTKNLIPEFLRQLEEIKKQLDEASGAYAQFPHDACGDGVGLPQFMLTACADFEQRINIPRIKQQVDELLERLNKLEEDMGLHRRRRSPNRGGAHKRTARVPRKQRKQRKSRKQRK
jgi:hypothetical protein